MHLSQLENIYFYYKKALTRVVRPITGKASYLFIAWAQPTAAMTGICATTPNNVLPLSILF